MYNKKRIIKSIKRLTRARSVQILLGFWGTLVGLEVVDFTKGLFQALSI